MERDELIRELAAVVAGLQVPVSMRMPLGTADAPARRLMQLCPGWAEADEYEVRFKEILNG